MFLSVLQPLARSGLALALATTLTGSEMCVIVLDETSQPLPRAQVKAVNLSSGKSREERTDSRGNACFPKLPEGAYSVEADLQGFVSAKYFPLSISYLRKRLLTIRLPLSSTGGDVVGQEVTLSGTLRRGGRIAERVSICLFRPDGSRVACTTTDDLGEYALEASPGVYQVELRPASGGPYRSQIDLSSPGAAYHDRLTLPGGQGSPK